MKRCLKTISILLFCVGTLIWVLSTKKVVYAEFSPFDGMVDADSLIIREKPDLKSKEITQIVFGSKVTVTGEDDNWYVIKYDENKTGYALKKYIIDINKYASTSGDYRTYCDSLIAKGFVESYCPQLYYLHMAYPNWEFTPDITGLTIEEASKEEENSAVLQTGNSNYYLRATPIETDYYYIKANVIASFLDPRNLMYPNYIFQFLDLESSKDIVNDAALENISGSKGNFRNYFEEFKQAALKNNVNAIHIMVRSRQEGANASTYDEEKKIILPKYAAVTGLYTTNSGRTSKQGFSLDHYFNFYNIGSYADKNYDFPVQRGLVYAAGFLAKDECISYKENEDKTKTPYYDDTKCGNLSYQRPWNDEAKAISGGAEFIVKSYISRGQNTLYYQKWNVSSKHYYNLYTHQYMTNSMAPISEATSLYNAYKAGDLLNSKFNFIIPVYKDLASEVAAPIDKNGDATLKEIKINNQLITGFDKDVVEYPYSLKTNEEEFTVDATPSSPLTKVTGTGKFNFTEGTAEVKIDTVAEDGSKKTYTITVKQVKYSEEIKVSDVTDKLDVKLDENYIYGISPGMTAQELINSISSANGTGVLLDSAGATKESGILVTGDKIKIQGTTESKEYIITITGDLNGDGKISVLDLLRCQKHILKSTKLEGAQNLAADANFDGKISVVDMLKIQKHILGKSKL